MVKEGRWLRFLDSDNLKILSKADHVIFSTEEGFKPSDGRPPVQKTFIIQLGKQNLINIDKLGFKEEFRDALDTIEAIKQGQSRYVRFESDPTLAKYMTAEKFDQLKEQIESK